MCAGDLHIGLEDEMQSKGVIVPSQTMRMERELVAMAEGCERLVLLGDIKHQVPGTSEQEHSELPRFFDALRRVFAEIDVVKGNHDVGIEDIAFEGVHIHPPSGFATEEVGFVHGHVWPSSEVMSSKTLVMAHNHPAVLFKDGVGNIMTERCWLRAKFNDKARGRYSELPEEVIVMPSMNPTIKGSPVNLEGGRLLGPLFAQGMIDVDEAKVYLLDGINLGTVRSLRVERPRRYRYWTKEKEEK